MQKRIEQRLSDAFQPEILEVTNESHKHQGHAGDDGSGESHFHVRIIASKLEDKTRLEKQRAVFSALKEEMTEVHALSISASEKDKAQKNKP